MKKQITIGDEPYEINYTQETADEVLNLVIQWMEDKSHYAAHSGEGIFQNDNCQIDAPTLIADIVDNILKPEYKGV